MQERRKFLLISSIILLILISLYFIIRSNPESLTQNETVNDVITILKELDKKPTNTK